MNLVFDLGAVVFRWRPMDLVRSHLPDQASGDEATRALAWAIFGHADWQAFDRGTLSIAQLLDRTSVRLGLARQALAALLAAIPGHLAPIGPTVLLLDRLRARREQGEGLRLFYLSNMPAPFARELERRHGFFQWFDAGIFSGDVGQIKPEPAIFELLARRHELVPAATLFIDDAVANVEAARTIGWHGIHFESTTQLVGLLAAHPGLELQIS